MSVLAPAPGLQAPAAGQFFALQEKCQRPARRKSLKFWGYSELNLFTSVNLAQPPGTFGTLEIASGSKLGIDATKKIPGEGFKRAWPPLIKMDEAVKTKVEKLLSRP
jgi:hypothetical protein